MKLHENVNQALQAHADYPTSAICTVTVNVISVCLKLVAGSTSITHRHCIHNSLESQSQRTPYQSCAWPWWQWRLWWIKPTIYVAQ